jgi:hypothetical protein
MPSLVVHPSTAGRASLHDSVVETIGGSPRRRIDPLGPALEAADRGRDLAPGRTPAEPIRALGPDNVNRRAGWPAGLAPGPLR